MTKDQYVHRCMDAWLVGWANVNNKEASAAAKGVVALDCVQEFQKMFPADKTVNNRPWSCEHFEEK